MRFKIFTGYDLNVLESEINDFVEQEDINIFDIRFCVDNRKVYVFVSYTLIGELYEE